MSATLTIRHANCKFCGKPLELEIDTSCPRAEADFWVKLAACNRCADYRNAIARLGESLRVICRTLLVVRGGNASSRAQVEEKCRTILVDKTKQYAKVICDHFHKMTVWEPDFAQMIFDKPQQLDTVLSGYRRGIPKA